MLLRAGAPVGVRNAAGRNCVHCAAMGGSGPVVSAVLGAAARPPRPCRARAAREQAGEEWWERGWGRGRGGGGDVAAGDDDDDDNDDNNNDDDHDHDDDDHDDHDDDGDEEAAEVGPDGWDAVARPEPLVHARDVNGVTPAEMAVRKGSADALRVLLAYGACGQRVWGLAVTLGNRHVLAVLDEWARHAA